MIKTRILSSLVGIVLILASCKKDGVDPTPKLLGEWNLSSIDVIFDDKVIPITEKGIADYGFNSLKYNFTSDTTLFYSEDDYSFEATYSYNANTGALQIIDDADFVYNSTVILDGDSLTLVSPTIDLTKEDLTESEVAIIFEAVLLLNDQTEALEAKFGADFEASSLRIEYKLAR